VPVGLSPAAAVNAVGTATEAKAQALFEAGVPGTGTASDAVVVVWSPVLPTEPFAGPRSTWGARIARAVHAAVRHGLEAHP
jgi:adenosylcobinamide amidohydrolase